MSRRNPENRKYKGGAGRALLVFLLTVLILAALVLGTLALLELYEQHSLDSFYTSLSRNSEWTADDGGEVSLPTLATVLPDAVTHDHPHLTPVPLDPPIPTRTVAILRRAGGYHSAAASAFVRLTQELVADRGYAPPG